LEELFAHSAPTEDWRAHPADRIARLAAGPSIRFARQAMIFMPLAFDKDLGDRQVTRSNREHGTLTMSRSSIGTTPGREARITLYRES
jgi:hypothetical protein